MAIVRPSLAELSRLPVPLNAGELCVAQHLAELDDSWTIYVQPRFAHDVPDFVAVHDRHGVCAIEVKNWAYGVYRQADGGEIEYTRGGVPHTIAEQPRYQAYRYRQTIYEDFFALPDDGDRPSQAVRAALILPQWSTEHARRLFERPQVTDREEQVPVWGGDELRSSVRRVVEGPGCPPPPPGSVDKLRRQLVEAVVVADQRAPVPLSADARNIAANPNRAQRRRVRGPAGCGKTFGLAARAARLAADGQNVLVLAFNTTLANYLRSLIDARCRELDANPTRVTCVTFHAFCVRLVEDARLAGFVTQRVDDTDRFDAQVEQARLACEAGHAPTYDAVLVDEGQDFTLPWWQLLRDHVASPDGEMLLVADPTQDVYSKQAWTDEAMVGSGFSGPWTTLAGSYRMPADVVAMTNRFAEKYVDGERLSSGVPIDAATLMGESTATVKRWVNIDRARDLGTAVGQAVVELVNRHDDLAWDDVVFLCQRHEHGLDAVQVIEQAGFPVHHVFAKRDVDRARRKRRFWPDAPGVKGCTIHSFKGWETPALVMGIGRDDESRRLAYVAMTRVRNPGSGRPAYLSVVNSDLRVAGFESVFTGKFAAVEIPGWAPPIGDDRKG